MRRAVFVFLASAILVISRRPDVLFHAQFWAEDGKFWYADAYNLGAIAPFFHPAAGYFQTLPRLAALFAVLFPLAFAPLLLNCIGIVVQVLPVQFLLSERCRQLGSFTGRCLFAFFYLALPNSQEMHVNITNQQWRLAFLALLIIYSAPGRTALWNAFDYAVLALSGLTGPFVIFIAPIAAVFAAQEKRSRWRAISLAVCCAGAAIEILSVLFAGGTERYPMALRAASFPLLLQILAKQVFLAALVGRRTLAAHAFASPAGLAVAAVAALAGLGVEIYVLWKAPLAWKSFIAFSTVILAVSLALPMTPPPQWPGMLQSGGVRYWFFSLLAFGASLFWLLLRPNPLWLRRSAGVLLLLMVFGIVQDWGHPRLIDMQFERDVREFAAAPPGTKFRIPLNPAGWFMQLMKRG